MVARPSARTAVGRARRKVNTRASAARRFWLGIVRLLSELRLVRQLLIQNSGHKVSDPPGAYQPDRRARTGAPPANQPRTGAAALAQRFSHRPRHAF